MTPTPFESPWQEIVARVAAELPGDDPDGGIFYEERSDLRVTAAAPDGPAEIVPSRLRGISAQVDRRSFHLSDPDPDDAISWVRRAVRDQAIRGESGKRRASSPPDPVLEPAETGREIATLAERVARSVEGPHPKVAVSLVAFRQAIWVAPQGGDARHDVRRGMRVRIDVSRARNGRQVAATEEWVARSPGEPMPPYLGQEAAIRLVERADAVTAATGEGAVLLSAGTSGVFVHEVVGHALEADTALRGGSLLARSKNARVPGAVVVIDDPRRGRAAWRWDDEGEPAGATALLRGGAVLGWLTDRRAAREAGRPRTGHGRRASYSEPIRPRMGCTFLAPGPFPREEVVESTRHGVLVRRMEAASTDPARGLAIFRVSDANRIRDGRVDAPLEPFLLRVRLPEALETLDMIGDDLEFDRCVGTCVRDGQSLATSVGGPTCRIGVATIVS